MKRDKVECGLEFAGFVIVSSPLKHDSKAIIRELKAASHYVIPFTKIFIILHRLQGARVL